MTKQETYFVVTIERGKRSRWENCHDVFEYCAAPMEREVFNFKDDARRYYDHSYIKDDFKNMCRADQKDSSISKSLDVVTASVDEDDEGQPAEYLFAEYGWGDDCETIAFEEYTCDMLEEE